MMSISCEVWRDPSALERVRLRDDFNAIVRSDRLAGVMRSGLRDGAVIIAALDEARSLLGYGTLVPSKLLDGRWRNLEDVYELGALEVARGVRRQGIATRLLRDLEAAIPLRRSIVFARGVLHHWDFDAAGTTPLGYRRLLMKLLRRAGFQHEETTDPEVADHPLHFLALRYGEEAASRSMYEVARRLAACAPARGLDRPSGGCAACEPAPGLVRPSGGCAACEPARGLDAREISEFAQSA